MIIEDTDKVVDVVFKHPSVMSDNAKEQIILRYDEIQSLKKKLSKLRMECSNLEQYLNDKESEFRSMSTMFELVFSTKEIKTIKNECNLTIVNPTDAARPTYKAGQ